MTSKYQLLARFLAESDQDMLRMTFKEVDEKIEGELPAAAWEHRAWWANSLTHSHARHGWLQAGYETSSVDMDGQELVFLRAPNIRAESFAADMAPASRRMAAPRIRRSQDPRLERIVQSVGSVDNLVRILQAIQEYIDGDLLETELGQILRKLWPRM